MTAPLDTTGWPLNKAFIVDTASDTYASKNTGVYQKLPEGVAIITLTNRSQGDVQVHYWDGARFDSESEYLKPGETRIIQRVVPPRNWGIRLDLRPGHPKLGWVGWSATVFPPVT